MDVQTALRTVISLVPNWYVADCGPFKHILRAGEETVEFFSHRRLTPELNDLITHAREDLPRLLSVAVNLPSVTAVNYIQEHFAKVWLRLRSPDINWEKLLDYLSAVSDRTYENQRVSYNFVIGEGEGSLSITDGRIQKIFDPLATSMHTFIKLNKDIEFAGYEEIRWEEIKDTQEYKFYPEFLQPIAGNLRPSEYSVHQTLRGDLVIMNAAGMVAAKRKGRWKLYDVNTFKNSIVDAIVDTVEGTRTQDYRVGCNLFEIMFDLSFKRHGALLVYDPNRRVLERVRNRGSIIAGQEADQAHSLLAPVIRGIQMCSRPHHSRKKRLLLEIASMDGAVLFTPTEVLAFGAMIDQHENAGNETGARSTAARSALYWGGLPIKVSADGEISIYFRSYGRPGGSCEAQLEFL